MLWDVSLGFSPNSDLLLKYSSWLSTLLSLLFPSRDSILRILHYMKQFLAFFLTSFRWDAKLFFSCAISALFPTVNSFCSSTTLRWLSWVDPTLPRVNLTSREIRQRAGPRNPRSAGSAESNGARRRRDGRSCHLPVFLSFLFLKCSCRNATE